MLTPIAIFVLGLPQLIYCPDAKSAPQNQAPFPTDGGIRSGATDAPTAPIILSTGRTTTCCGEEILIQFTTGDDLTPIADLRYAASFGATEAEASAAPFSLLFAHDASAPLRVTAVRNRTGYSGEGFDRGPLCATLAAIDAAGNVSAKSAPFCVDNSPVQGQCIPRQGPVGGCTSAPNGLVSAAIGLLWLRRRRNT